MKINLRKTFFQLHLWAGLIVGLFLLIISVTGVILVYKPQIEDRLNRALFHIQPAAGLVTVDEIVANARRAHPERKVSEIKFFGGSDRSAMVVFAQGDEVYVNPHTGAVVGQRNLYHTFLYKVEMLHRALLMGRPGKVFMAIVSIFSLFIMGTGIYLWAPRTWKKVKSAFVLSKSKGRAWMVSLHNMIGVYSAVVVFILSATAIPLVFNSVRMALFYKATGSPLPLPEPESQLQAGAKRIPLQAAWHELTARIPSYQFAVIELPQEATDSIMAYAVATDAPTYNARSYLYLDAYSGNVLRYEPYAQQSLGARLYSWNKPLHLGLVAGPFGQPIALAGILSLVGLILTGTWLFLRRKVFKPASKPAPQAGRKEQTQRDRPVYSSPVPATPLETTAAQSAVMRSRPTTAS